MTQANSSHRDPKSSGGIVLTVGITLLLTTWGVHQFSCPERTAKKVDATPEIIRIVVLEGKCYFSAKSNKSARIHDFDQELVIDEGREYELNVESNDYVYSLHQSELSLNVVAVPDMILTSSFLAEQAGSYELELSPMCGFPWKHQGSPGVVIIEKRWKGICD